MIPSRARAIWREDTACPLSACVIPNLTESRGFGYYQNDYYSDYYVKSEEMKKQQTKDKKNRKKKGDSDNV